MDKSTISNDIPVGSIIVISSIISNVWLDILLLFPLILAVSIYRAVFGFFNFSLGILYTAFMYLPYFVIGRNPFDGLIILLAVVVVLFAHLILLNSLRDRGMSSEMLLIVSVGVYMVVEQIVSIGFGDITLFADLTLIGVESVFERRLLESLIFILIVPRVIYLMLFRELGLQVEAIASSPQLFSIVGLNKKKLEHLAMWVVVVLIAISGFIAGLENGARPSAGFTPMLSGFAIVLFGGRPRILSLYSVFLLYVVVNQSGGAYLPSQWSNIVNYSCILALLYFVRVRRHHS